MNTKKTENFKAILRKVKNPTPSFYDVMVKRLSKKKADKIERTIRDLLKSRNSQGDDIWNADYANAFGIMQGVAYALGYDSACITNVEWKPGYWFDQILKEYPLQKQDVAALTKRDPDMSMSLIDTISVNVNNDKLSDADFRKFIINSLPLTMKAMQ